TGSGLLDRDRTMLRGFAQDAWTVSPRLTLLYGARFDYDSYTGEVNAAPRGTVTAMLTADARTVLHGGAGLFYAPVPLNVAAFEQYQERTVTNFLADGTTPAETMAFANETTTRLHTPRGVNVNVELDRELAKDLFVRVTVQQREMRREPIATIVPNALL